MCRGTRVGERDAVCGSAVDHLAVERLQTFVVIAYQRYIASDASHLLSSLLCDVVRRTSSALAAAFPGCTSPTTSFVALADLASCWSPVRCTLGLLIARFQRGVLRSIVELERVIWRRIARNASSSGSQGHPWRHLR